tara:strand:+ start:1221 stop:1934 length:714 start_codon:yes stop_codon:yes gene_type:complete
MDHKKVIALIPARGGSKGVPKKNIKNLCGKPLIYYSIKACKIAQNIDRVIVSTDDYDIANIARKFGAEVPFMRPTKFASDLSTDFDVVTHFFEQIDADEIAYIRPTTPLRDPIYIDAAIEQYFNARYDITGMRSMHELPESPYKVLKINGRGLCEGFFQDFQGIEDYTNLPRQIFPAAYQPNGYVDLIKKETVLSGSTFGEKVLPYVTDFLIEVDSPYQFKMLEDKIKVNGHRLVND